MDTRHRTHDALSRLADRPGQLRHGSGPPTRGTGLATGAAAAPPPADAPLWRKLFGDPALSLAEAGALADLACPRQVAQGDPVLNRSQCADALVALQSGQVALGLRTADGQFRVERIVRGPAWLDLSSAWLDGPSVMDGQALGPALLVEWPRDALAQRLPRLPGLAQRLIRRLAQEVQALAVNTHELMHKDAPARLAHWLHQHCEPVSGQAGQAVVRLHDRKRDLASQLAITPETLSRLMRSFSSQGVIEVAGYSVRVLDPAALARLARC